MSNNQNLLVLDDEAGFRSELTEFLESEGHTVYHTGLPSEAINLITSNRIDIALFDIRLPEMSGLELLKKIKADYSDVNIIMMTGYGNMESVVDALRFGAVDFLSKPFKLGDLGESINRISKYKKAKKIYNGDPSTYDKLLEGQLNLVGENRGMLKLKEAIQKVAQADDATVLVTGESGTGKELVARSVHLLSERKKKKFIPVNCSSIPSELFENEFFGHVKGSYTDAKTDQKGLFELAHKGTLFLDEIGDMKQEMQSKLLRVIEEKKISRLGHYDEIKVDVRIISATNQDIEKMLKENNFRKDLYHRLNLFRIDVPPLRERLDDIPLLVDHFVDLFKVKFNKPIQKIDKSIYSKLATYDYPGNVRELKHMVERAVILSEGNTLNEKDFTNLDILSKSVNPSKEMGFDTLNLDQIEKKSILKALEIAGNNKSKAARMLNISRQALDRKMNKLGIRVK